MITNIRASGFRSLNDFELELRPGLNILVGPNGGGKTNILALLSFISSLATDQVGDVISSAGGVSKVFKKLPDGLFAKTICVGVKGRFDLSTGHFYTSPPYRVKLTEASVSSIEYEWDCEVDASAGYDQTVLSAQTLKIRVVLRGDSAAPRDFDFILKCKAVPGGVHYDEIIIDESRASLIHQSKPDDDGRHFQVENRIALQLNTTPIFRIFENPEILTWLGFSLKGGRTFNFDPAACKLANDSARSPKLEPDGDGLARVIYAMERSDSIMNDDLFQYSRAITRVTFDNLSTYFGLINPSIIGLFAKNNPYDNRIIVFLRVAGEDDAVVDFPLEFASDGTVKWLAFNVALLTNKSGFSIEEPENFLHPEMQRHAVQLIRTEIGDRREAFVLMTTHSESLLNAALPDEIIVISMEEGKTRARRLSDPYLLSEEIRETGFGLGYYYISGALDE
jgi:predicted ATPase